MIITQLMIPASSGELAYKSSTAASLITMETDTSKEVVSIELEIYVEKRQFLIHSTTTMA